MLRRICICIKMSKDRRRADFVLHKAVMAWKRHQQLLSCNRRYRSWIRLKLFGTCCACDGASRYAKTCQINDADDLLYHPMQSWRENARSGFWFVTSGTYHVFSPNLLEHVGNSMCRPTMKKVDVCERVAATDMAINASTPALMSNTYLLVTGHVGRKSQMFLDRKLLYVNAELWEKVSAKTKLCVIFYSRKSSIDLISPYVVYVT